MRTGIPNIRKFFLQMLHHDPVKFWGVMLDLMRHHPASPTDPLFADMTSDAKRLLLLEAPKPHEQGDQDA